MCDRCGGLTNEQYSRQIERNIQTYGWTMQYVEGDGARNPGLRIQPRAEPVPPPGDHRLRSRSSLGLPGNQTLGLGSDGRRCLRRGRRPLGVLPTTRNRRTPPLPRLRHPPLHRQPHVPPTPRIPHPRPPTPLAQPCHPHPPHHHLRRNCAMTHPDHRLSAADTSTKPSPPTSAGPPRSSPAQDSPTPRSTTTTSPPRRLLASPIAPYPPAPGQAASSTRRSTRSAPSGSALGATGGRCSAVQAVSGADHRSFVGAIAACRAVRAAVIAGWVRVPRR